MKVRQRRPVVRFICLRCRGQPLCVFLPRARHGVLDNARVMAKVMHDVELLRAACWEASALEAEALRLVSAGAEARRRARAIILAEAA